MRNVLERPSRPWLGEKLLALSAAVVCLVVTAYVWQVVASQQPIWPLPVLYLIEVLVLSSVALIVTVYGSRVTGIVLSIITGAILAFAVMGLFSIGLLYFPIAGLFALSAILSTWRSRQSALLAIARAIGAATVQVIVMFAVISIR